MSQIELPSIAEINDARIILNNKGITSSLVKDEENILLKLDCQLPGGSYKIRGVKFFAANNHFNKEIQVLSAGNLALATAQRLKEDNIHCKAIAPEGISQIKRQGLEKMGASIDEQSFTEIWNLVHDNHLRQSSTFLHPFNKYLLAGYATIILELRELNFNNCMLVVPYGLGGLALALAHAIDLLKMNIKLVICEIVGAAPFSRARAAGKPINGDKLKSFIEAMGTPSVITDIFLFLKDRIANVIEVTEEEVKREIYLTFQRHNLRIEGAAGASLASAKKLKSSDPIISLLTGSNISDETFQGIITHLPNAYDL